MVYLKKILLKLFKSRRDTTYLKIKLYSNLKLAPVASDAIPLDEFTLVTWKSEVRRVSCHVVISSFKSRKNL